MNYAINILFLLTLIILIGRKQPNKDVFFIGVGLKVIAGICLGLIYLYYYKEGDTLRYWEAAQDLTKAGFSPWWSSVNSADIGHFENQPRAILFSKIVSGFIILTKGDYWVVSAYLSTFSFFTYWYFFRQIRTTLPNLKWPVIIGFLLLPSTLFWSAGIMKGVLTNASVVFLAAFALKIFFKKQIHLSEIIPLILSILVLFYIKYYVLIVLSPAIIYVLIDGWAFKTGIAKSLRVSLYGIILIGTVAIAPSLNPNLSLRNLPKVIHKNQKVFGPNQTIPTLIEPTWSSLLSTAPTSLFIGLFGPTLLVKGKVFGLVPRVENLFILLAFLLSLYLLLKQRLFSPDILVIGAAAFVILLAIFLPLAAPNYGAMVRYRAPVTPFLTTLVLILPIWRLQKD